jgi:hypothetical protein
MLLLQRAASPSPPLTGSERSLGEGLRERSADFDLPCRLGREYEALPPPTRLLLRPLRPHVERATPPRALHQRRARQRGARA